MKPSSLALVPAFLGVVLLCGCQNENGVQVEPSTQISKRSADTLVVDASTGADPGYLPIDSFSRTKNGIYVHTRLGCESVVVRRNPDNPSELRFGSSPSSAPECADTSRHPVVAFTPLASPLHLRLIGSSTLYDLPPSDSSILEYSTSSKASGNASNTEFQFWAGDGGTATMLIVPVNKKTPPTVKHRQVPHDSAEVIMGILDSDPVRALDTATTSCPADSLEQTRLLSYGNGKLLRAMGCGRNSSTSVDLDRIDTILAKLFRDS